MIRPPKPVRWSLLSLALPLAAGAASSLEELAAAIGPADSRAAFDGIVARAAASGPRGDFTSEVVSLADGTVRFRLGRADGSNEMLLAAGRPLRRNPESGRLEPANPALASFLSGHEVHRMLLDLERRFTAADATEETAAPGCLPLVGPYGLGARICRAPAAGSALPERLELDQPEAMGGQPVSMLFSDWRHLHGVRLPFAVEFLHAGERHAYRYTEVLPFRLAPNSPLPTEPEALDARLGDLAALAAAHERALDAHRASDVERLLGDEAERSIVSGRGTLTESGRDALRERLAPYLAGIRFERYEDVAIPVIAVAADGSLGWLACEIEAAGSRRRDDGTSEPLAYGFSWVELYARSDTGWLRVGNASSPRP